MEFLLIYSSLHLIERDEFIDKRFVLITYQMFLSYIFENLKSYKRTSVLIKFLKE